MFNAALWSRSSEQPHAQECQRSSRSLWTMAPHWLQSWLVYVGSTNTTRRPALSALALQKDWHWPQPASRIDWFNPALAAAPLGRYSPSWSGSGFGSGAFVMFRIARASIAIRPYSLTRRRESC